MSWNIGSGTSTVGGDFDKAAHEGHLIYGVDGSLERNVKTSFGESDAMRFRYFGCITCGLVVSDYLLFGTALVPVFAAEVEAGYEIVAGRLEKGAAKPGQSAPYLLAPASDEDRAAVGVFFDENAVRAPSGTIVLESPTF